MQRFMYLQPIKYLQHPIKNITVASTKNSLRPDFNNRFEGMAQGKRRPLR